jgi:DNA-binding response OmpR family regulator
MMSSLSQNITILIVDDDEVVSHVISSFLVKKGYKVLTTPSGSVALQILEKGGVDIAILDVIMPEINGLDLLFQIRKEIDIPILIMTTLSQQDTVKSAFLSGADDYLVKPFKPDELMARLESLQALVPPREEPEIVNSGEISLNLTTGQIHMSGKTGSLLSDAEMHLLNYFIDHPDVQISESDLIQAGWNREWDNSIAEKEMLRLAINHLRQKIEKDPENPEYLPLINGDGYLFHPVK